MHLCLCICEDKSHFFTQETQWKHFGFTSQVKSIPDPQTAARYRLFDLSDPHKNMRPNACFCSLFSVPEGGSGTRKDFCTTLSFFLFFLSGSQDPPAGTP